MTKQGGEEEESGRRAEAGGNGYECEEGKGGEGETREGGKEGKQLNILCP